MAWGEIAMRWNNLFTGTLPNTETILVKPYMGHTLGASGALETAFLIEHLQKTNVKCGHFLNYFFRFLAVAILHGF